MLPVEPRRALKLVVSAALLAISGCATAPPGIGDTYGLNPYWDWKTIETDHFRVTFPAELQDVANRSANYLEEANTTLSKQLLWTPRHKAQVLIIDNTDAANGLTSPVGRFGMIFYVTPPDNWFSTYYYDDWLRLLAFHEYTHYLNMDTTSKYADMMRVIFGDVTLPNSLWPSWMLEGLAVYMETRFTHSGRGRSPFYEMVLRSAVESKVLDTHAFVTIDRVNGTNPYSPGGETAYLFGYSLMNQLATQDESLLGRMSSRSGGRLPFLINGNLEDLSGKDWYAIWNEWIQRTTERAEKQLAAIRAKGVTPFTHLTQGAFQTRGSAVSPDGHWLAYTQETETQRFSIWLKDIAGKTGAKPVPLTEKLLGSSIAFTPDSKAILYSSLRRDRAYLYYSDLAIYDLEHDRMDWLSSGLRARDPDLSPDGNQVVFTLTQKATTGIALATLEKRDGRYQLGPVRILFMPPEYDASYTPKFSRDGKSIFFSVHRNGHTREDLLSVEAETGAIHELVADGGFNRFPAVHPNGDLYFVSDRSGIENIYRYRPGAAPEAMTNVTTGVAFPQFSPTGRLYTGLFSFTGWDLAEVDSFRAPASASVSAQPPKIDPAPIPTADAQSVPSANQKNFPAQDYSAFPSLWPRQWAPLFLASPGGAYVGGEVVGFDAIDRHRYLAALAYQTQVQKPDSLVYYANRSLGPTLTFTAQNTTSNIYTAADTSLLAYTRQTKYHFDVSYPFRWTYSVLVPSIAANTEQNTLFTQSPSGSYDAAGWTRYVPSVDGLLTFSNLESSALAITPEDGRATQVGARSYLGLNVPVFKGLIKDVEHIHLGAHTVLVPTAKYSWVSSTSDYAPALVNVQSNVSGNFLAGLPADNLDQLVIRGYPNQYFYAKSAGIFSLDLRFPLLQIYRGWGTNPAYLDNLYGFTFAEAATFPGGEPGAFVLPSVGAGLRLNAELLLHVPVMLSGEFHRGLNDSVGGAGEFVLQMGVGALGF